MGSDPRNRQGLGLRVDGVYSLGYRVFGIGFCDGIPDPCCMNKEPGNNEQLDFNINMVKTSDGRLPPVDEFRLDHFAFSCNHTLWFLKCAEAGMPSEFEEMCNNGRLSVTRIGETDPVFAKRIREGMVRLVIDWRTRLHYPELIELIILSKNLPGEINQRASAFEVLSQIWTLSQTEKDENGYPDWAKVKRAIGQTKPECYAILPELVEFVIACSGGASGAFLHELTSLWKNCKLEGLTRNVPAKIWKALAGSGHPGGDPMPRFKNMFILTTLCAEKETVEDGLCSFITPADCGIFSSSKPSVLEVLRVCNKTLNDGFELVALCRSTGVSAHGPGVSAPHADVNFSTLRFATCVVRFALSEFSSRQRQPEGLQYKTAEAIGFDFLAQLRQTWSNVDELAAKIIKDSAWKPDEKKSENEKQGKQGGCWEVGVRLTEMTGDGQLANLEDRLGRKGFKLGEHVKNKTTNDLWEVAKFDEAGEGKIILHDVSAGRRRVNIKHPVTLATFLSQYTRPPTGYENKLLHEDESWKQFLPRASRGGSAARAKMDVLAALEIASLLHPDENQPVQPMLNLKNANAGVQAASYAKAGSIVLVPWTTQIVVDFPGDPNLNKPAPWTAKFEVDSPLARFARDEDHPRVSLAAQSYTEKADETPKEPPTVEPEKPQEKPEEKPKNEEEEKEEKEEQE